MADVHDPFALGDWLVEPALNRISCGSQGIHLRQQVMEVLVYLAGRNGKIATLESIHDDLWAGKVVSSGTIYNCIAELRHAFAASGSGIEYIETLPKKGYRIAPHILTLPVASATERAPLSIAVLPLVNRSATRGVDYLCDAIADEILYCMANVGGLRVCSARALRNEQLDPRVAGLRYGATLVLSGSLQMHGQQLRTLFRLERVADGEIAWCGRFDQTADDLVELQETVARQVVEAVAPPLAGNLRQSSSLDGSGTRSLEALQAFLLGRYAQSQMTIAGYNEAIACFEKAVQLDPSFGRAHYRLYLACYQRRRYFGVDEGGLDKARTAASNAREHGYRPAVPWVHIQRRLYPETRLTSRQLALEAIDKIRNGDAEWTNFAREQLTWVLADAGLFEAALAFARKLLISPNSNFQDSDIDEEVPVYTAACGKLDDAIALWSGLIQKDPAQPLFRCERAILYARSGQYPYANMDIAALTHHAYRTLSEALLAYYQGQMAILRERHQVLLAIPAIHPTLTLCSWAMLGDIDNALEHYERAVNEPTRAFVDFGATRAMTRARLPPYIVTAIETHPRFAVLMAAQGIDATWQQELKQRVNAIADVTGILVAAESGGSSPVVVS